MPVRPLRLHGVVLPTGDRRDLFVDGGRLSFTPIDGAETVVEDGWLIPGLVDAHAHLALASPAPEGSPVAAAVRASAKAQLDAGVLVIREPGGPSRDSREVGPHEQLPRVFSGGRFLAAPGGYFPGLAREVEPGDLAAAAVEESQASGHWAKVVGDFIDGRGRFAPTLELGALRAAVEAVHAVGGRLAIHAMTAGAIEMAIEAGVDSIEHATELAPEHLPAIARKGIALVPTMLIREPILATARGMGLPDGEQRRWEEALDRQPEMVRRASATGVLILAGTDAGMVAHGLILDEVAQMMEAGLAGDVALGGASWTARRFLGLPGIEEGAPADIVAFGGDPRLPGRAGPPLVRILDGRVVG
jgi:imidazolonepropionase-like amidohydrolase